ncbi:hypothetical protein V5O48_008738 [Marasmius crinis-equi]|uniref:Oxidoreductase FAD/NAD(P)-binding domain-containing protein n=1 Tax=Marasmius crinis-equi TaxID=585013 RepID=A0ABR3FDJ5_9AGAR
MNGWHPGERVIHQKLGTNMDPGIQRMYTYINGDLDPHHAIFHTTCLPFLPVTTVAEDGRPWGSILAAEDGLATKAGGGRFIEHPRYTVLTINTKVWVGDPLLETRKAYKWNEEDGKSLEDERDDGMLISGIGLEFTTRRRNKLAGRVTKFKATEDNHIDMEIFVNESMGNCPKYINVRSLSPYTNTNPRIKWQSKNMAEGERMPQGVIDMITSSDTVFIGTTYKAKPLDRFMYPSHTGMNQRGGLPGFIRVSPSDGKTVYVPDFSGNRIMTSLGNIEATPLASLTFMNWVNGDVLYLTGRARNLVGAEAQKVMPNHQHSITEVEVTGYTFVEDANTVRQTPGTKPERSPYSPPVRLLAEEDSKTVRFETEEVVKASLASIELHGKTVATFTWEATQELDIKPGQAIILDLKPFLGTVRYQHMSAGKPSSVNDDRIRTWTVSSAQPGPSKRFRTTMKWKEGGTATTTLFTIAHKLKDLQPELLSNTKELELNVRVAGITGEFSMPIPQESGVKKLLWIAGGVGFTPFMSMLEGFSQRSEKGTYDVLMLLSTREPEVLVPIMSRLQAMAKGKVRLTLAVFSRGDFDSDVSAFEALERHKGRLDGSFFSQSPLLADAKEREAYLCGPPEFEEAVVGGLNGAGIYDRRKACKAKEAQESGADPDAELSKVDEEVRVAECKLLYAHSRIIRPKALHPQRAFLHSEKRVLFDLRTGLYVKESGKGDDARRFMLVREWRRDTGRGDDETIRYDEESPPVATPSAMGDEAATEEGGDEETSGAVDAGGEPQVNEEEAHRCGVEFVEEKTGRLGVAVSLICIGEVLGWRWYRNGSGL